MYRCTISCDGGGEVNSEELQSICNRCSIVSILERDLSLSRKINDEQYKEITALRKRYCDAYDTDGCKFESTGKMNQLQQENTQLKSDLQALRERLQELEAQNQFCTICGKWEGHKEGCVLKAELDKLKGDE